jgi:adenylate kinase
MGPPGAGKGTQGDLLARSLGVPRYSTGDILRKAQEEGTPLGREALRYMDAGELVPDDVILGIVGEVVSRPEAQRGFVLDGFPRTVVQARGLAGLLERRGERLDAVVDLLVEADEIRARLEARGRSDDTDDTIRRRLEVYRARTKPVLEWYDDSDVEVLSIDGVGLIQEIQQRIAERLGRGCS